MILWCDESIMGVQKSKVCWGFRVRISVQQGLKRRRVIEQSNPHPIASLQAWCLFSYFIKNQQKTPLEGSKEGKQQPEKGKCNCRALKALLKVETAKVTGTV